MRGILRKNGHKLQVADTDRNGHITKETDLIQDERLMPKPGIYKINWWQNMGQISDIWE